ncbi:MAG: hypothetical protein HC853_00210 [Anaerolineae bacterium]|nr:hypothetical protein [Anaerolineae bacterium]
MYTTDQVNSAQVREALHAIQKGKLAKLGDSPLAMLDLVRAKSASDTAIARGTALRTTLFDCLNDIEKEGRLVAHSPSKHHALILRNYLNGLSWRQTGETINASRAEYFRELSLAIENLTSSFISHLHEQRIGIEVQSNGQLVHANSSLSIEPPYIALHLYGRDELLNEIKTFLCRRKGEVVSLWGIPGIGKTSLAIRVANDPEIQGEFVDGVIWTSLGRTPNIRTILMAWAIRIGIQLKDSNTINIAELARLINAGIGQRRMLFVIDDAWTLDAALALNIITPNCNLLLSTRFPELASSLSTIGSASKVVHIAEIALDQSIALLESCLPLELHSDFRSDLKNIALLTRNVPLALWLAGNYLRRAARSGSTRRLSNAIEKLSQGGTLISLTEPTTAVIGSLSETNAGESIEKRLKLSEDALSDSAREAFWALGYLGGRPCSFTESAALAVSAATHTEIDELCDFGLLDISPDGQLILHPLIADFALARLRTAGDFETTRANHTRYFLKQAQSPTSQQLDTNLSQINAAISAAISDNSGAYDDQLFDAISVLAPAFEDAGLLEFAEQFIRDTLATKKNCPSKVKNKLLVRLASIQLSGSNPKQAILSLDQLSSHALDEHDEFHSLTIRAEALSILGIYPASREACQAALKLAYRAKSNDFLCDVSSVQARLKLLEFDRSQDKSSPPTFNDLIHKATTQTQFKIKQSTGLVALGLGHYRHSLQLCQDCRNLAIRLNNKRYLIESTVGLAFLNYSLGNFDNALQNADEAIELGKGAATIPIICLAFTTKSLIFLAWGRTIDAKNMALEGHSIAEERGFTEHTVSTACQLTRAYAWLGDNQYATLYSCKALNDLGPYQRRDHFALAKSEAAQAAGSVGEYEAADALLNEALKKIDGVMPGVRTHLQAIRGECSLRLGQVSQASQWFEKCLVSSTKSETPQYRAYALFGKARCSPNRQDGRVFAEQSLTLYSNLRHVHAAAVSEWLSGSLTLKSDRSSQSSHWLPI